VPVHDFGEIEGRLFVDMRLVEASAWPGCSRTARSPPQRRWQSRLELCDSLEAAHSVGLVHGDLRPQSVLLGGTNNGFVQLLDFGLAEPRLGAVISWGHTRR
jgi:serine/threonine protein kinase